MYDLGNGSISDPSGRLMSRWVYRLIRRLVGVRELYREVVVADRTRDLRRHIRSDLAALLAKVDADNPFFRGKFTQFLQDHAADDDEAFLAAYGELPVFTKEDYARAGQAVMSSRWADVDPQSVELQVDGRLVPLVRRLRSGDFLMSMGTGGSSALPLVVRMTRHHMFSMLFTFLKCWHRMGWELGDRMMIFYPRNTYNIDDMVKLNRWGWLTGLNYQLFDRIDERVVRDLVTAINRFRPKLLLVFPSPMNMVAHTIRRLNLPLEHHPPLINVSGETFFDCQRANIASVFTRSRIEDSYGSVELGEIAHQTRGGLEVFANVAYVETRPNAAGQSEMVVTRLHLTDFPFIRYAMKDIADVAWVQDGSGRELCLLTKIEGKDTNFILAPGGRRLYPSFFNRFVNELNARHGGGVVEIKVQERDMRHLDVQLIVKDPAHGPAIAASAQRELVRHFEGAMHCDVRCVDFIDHDYRRKYRVIQRVGDIEFAGGIVGDARKAKTIRDVEVEQLALPSNEADLSTRA
jgi:phenylacetate-coenzyme A ligase PaaK-like adenylate-forming protein